MKSIVIHGPKDLRIEATETTSPGVGEVQITMAAGGICGSDLHYYNHGGFGAIKLREPMVLGHEVTGYITEIGAGVDGLKIGQLVAVSPSRHCRNCKFCLDGAQNQCLNMRFYGSAMPFPHIQGAFRQVLNADASQCVVADGLSAGEAAMAEPLAVCLHATRRAGSMVGKSVLVTGCGPIGVLSILSARRAGADFIVATDLSDFTLNMAKQIGADMTIPMMAITAKELALKGSFRFHEEFETSVHLMQKGLIDVNPLITHRVSIEHAQDGFDLAADRTQAMKTQISFAEA